MGDRVALQGDGDLLKRPAHPLRRRAVPARATSKENVMIQNEGMIDRVVRVIAGLALLSLVVVGPRTWIGLVGIVPLVTGFMGYCPLYRVLGIRTCRTTP